MTATDRSRETGCTDVLNTAFYVKWNVCCASGCGYIIKSFKIKNHYIHEYLMGVVVFGKKKKLFKNQKLVKQECQNYFRKYIM